MQFDPNSELELNEDPMLDESVPSLTRTQLSQRLSLSIGAPVSDGPYPTSKIQKGPVLVCGSTDLSGEGVGLGVPIAKFAHRVFFPGKAHITERLTDDQRRTWIVDYRLNLEERLTLKSGRMIQNENFYALKEWFAGPHKIMTFPPASTIFFVKSSTDATLIVFAVTCSGILRGIIAPLIPGSSSGPVVTSQ